MMVRQSRFSRAWVHSACSVYAAAVGLQRDHLAVRARDRRAGGQRQADADGAAGKHEPVVRRAADAVQRKFTSLGDGFIAHDGLLGQGMRDQDIDGGAGELAAGGHLVGRNRRGQARRVGGDAQLIGQPFQRLRQILFLRGQHDSAQSGGASRLGLPG